MVVSFIGMATQEVTIKANLNIVLKSDTEQLDDVMVVAYGTAKKSSFTGSAAAVKNEKIAKMQTSDVTKALAGAVAGVQITTLQVHLVLLKIVSVVLALLAHQGNLYSGRWFSL